MASINNKKIFFGDPIVKTEKGISLELLPEPCVTIDQDSIE